MPNLKYGPMDNPGRVEEESFAASEIFHEFGAADESASFATFENTLYVTNGARPAFVSDFGAGFAGAVAATFGGSGSFTLSASARASTSGLNSPRTPIMVMCAWPAPASVVSRPSPC